MYSYIKIHLSVAFYTPCTLRFLQLGSTGEVTLHYSIFKHKWIKSSTTWLHVRLGWIMTSDNNIWGRPVARTISFGDTAF